MNICVFSSSRADYGLLKPVLIKLRREKKIKLKLIVSGSHNKDKYGNTISEIQKDKFKYNLISFPNNLDSKNLLNSKFLNNINKVLNKIKPKSILVLGDRVETFLVVAAAFICNIPIAHISGGEVTTGSKDDCFRHAITKLSYYHFVSNKEYYKRVLQLGEEKKRVFITGNLASENLKKTKLLNRLQIEKKLNIKLINKIILITYHPMTLVKNYKAEEFNEVLKALNHFKNIQYVFTSPNMDKGNDIILKKIKKFILFNNNAIFVKSFGQEFYYSLIKISDCVLGNSSSGVTEVPLFGKPTINIGSRQNGRIMHNSIINCPPNSKKIIKSIKKIYEDKSKLIPVKNLYKNDPSDLIIKKLKKLLKSETYVKSFNDL